MEDKTIIQLVRSIGGVVLLAVHGFTGVDGMMITVAMFLLGVPVEYLRRSKPSVE